MAASEESSPKSNSIDESIKNLRIKDLSLIPESKNSRQILEVLEDAKHLLEMKQEMLKKNVDNLLQSQVKMVSLMDGIKQRFITYSNDDLAQLRLDKLQHMTQVFDKMEEEIDESQKEIKNNETKLILIKVDIAKARLAHRLHKVNSL